jgi:hypothetical protein
MNARVLVLGAVPAALAVLAVPGVGGAAGECNGIPRCIPVEGPWVAVPPNGEAKFMLQCPQGRGIVAGTDALADTQDVRATFDAILGSPVSFGRSTSTAVLFRAVSAHHRAGLFKPFVGCIPAPTSVRNTIATKAMPLGAPLDLRAVTLKLTPGLQRTLTVACPNGESLVDSWNATAFTGANQPSPALASAVRVNSRIVKGRAQLQIFASEALPRSAQAELQIGVRCATG